MYSHEWCMNYYGREMVLIIVWECCTIMRVLQDLSHVILQRCTNLAHYFIYMDRITREPIVKPKLVIYQIILCVAQICGNTGSQYSCANCESPISTVLPKHSWAFVLSYCIRYLPGHLLGYAVHTRVFQPRCIFYQVTGYFPMPQRSLIRVRDHTPIYIFKPTSNFALVVHLSSIYQIIFLRLHGK